MKALILLIASTFWLGARTIEPFDADWRFHHGEAEGAEEPGFDSSAWRKLDVPHDWSIEGEFREDAPTEGSGGWLPAGLGWYRKTFEVPAEWKDKKVWIEFDGVMANSDVWINGHHLGHRPYGYISFRYELSEHLDFEGENVISVSADNRPQPASRWYTGAGIYRHVRLVAVDPTHIAYHGMAVTTPEVEAGRATIEIKAEIEGAGEKPVTLRHRIVAPDGREVAVVETKSDDHGGEQPVVSASVVLDSPVLWDIDRPRMYRLVSEVLVDGEVRDELTTPFGIRSAEFRPATGFWLNGDNFKLKGVCLHHAAGGVGAAVPLRVWERRFEKLKELGVNAIRTAHNPVDPGFLDLCDSMGLLVMNEAFDVWKSGKRAHDYHQHFEEWAHRDLRDMIRRDRNHPSVILYGVGNEIRDTPRAEEAKRILAGLIEVCKENDPSRPVTQGLFRPNSSGDYDNGLADMLDVIGTNYRDEELLAAWEEDPSRKIVGTEHGHARGTWFRCRDNPQHSGQFLWTGIDYLGEAREWPVTTYNSGLLDRTGVLYPRGAERQSWWSDKPVVHIYRRVAPTEEAPTDPGYEVIAWDRRQVLFPDWNPWKEDRGEQNVEVYANAAEVELLLNGESLGSKKVRPDFALNWKVPFEPGTLTAIARDEDGEEVARHELRTAGPAAKLVLTTDQAEIRHEFDDVAHLEVRVVDADGVLVPDASPRIEFSVDGPGRLTSVDSGSITSHEPFRADHRDAFQGRCLAVVHATAGEGEITFRARAEGLDGDSVTIQVAEEGE